MQLSGHFQEGDVFSRGIAPAEELLRIVVSRLSVNWGCLELLRHQDVKGRKILRGAAPMIMGAAPL